MNKTILIPDRIKENIEIEKKVFGDGYNIIAKGCLDKNAEGYNEDSAKFGDFVEHSSESTPRNRRAVCN